MKTIFAAAAIGGMSMLVGCGGGAALAPGQDGSVGADQGPVDHGPGPVPQRAGALYVGDLWTKPAGAQFGASTCRIRRVTGCEQYVEPNLAATAVDGSRLVALIAGGSVDAPRWDLLVSDDLGATVRRFALEGLTGNGRDTALHLHAGRIFVLASLTDPVLDTIWTARVFEVDPVGGAVTPRGGDATMSDARLGYATGDGALTTVAFARNQAPELVGITRFDPATNRISRTELPCPGAACELGATDFLSSDGVSFTLLTHPASDARMGCVVTVDSATKTVSSECLPALTGLEVGPFSSFGGAAFDFATLFSDGAPDLTIAPVTRQWIPTAPGMHFPADQLFQLPGPFFAFSPSGGATAGDEALLRLDADGGMKQTSVPHDGCFTLRGFASDAHCAAVQALLPLAGDEILTITKRDELPGDDQSRFVFEVARSSAPFTAFRP